MISILLANLTFVVVALFAVWALSLALRDASIVDVFWGPGFAGIALVTLAVSDASSTPQWLAASLAVVWGLRLGGYLLWRAWGSEEDPRYQRMRRHHGNRFPLVSLYTVFGFQGGVMFVVSLPVQVAVASPPAGGATWLHALGLALWSVGMLFESVADVQLARFKSDRANVGRVLDRGLWRYTRHPNYFGDFCVWWGLFALALAVPGGAWTVVGPALMTYLLLRVSGVPMLERGMTKRRPDYAAYVERTSAFFPRPPRNGRRMARESSSR